ncbi:hypothetical protein E1193_04740 [Micromonospora sp. KC606]|uniref:sigma factor n=1 Tax=Micromonospora sp. KC606 TaxID=2530379 RepID=UPI00104E8F9E|nr:sigma factor [Micromonospora sp. KC606]TDC84868.1 hypothetical protein E1193_04740 [Micromonospora sp. KC606]
MTRDRWIGDDTPPQPGPEPPGLAFDDFYHAQFRRLVVQLTAYTGDPGRAQDLVQEALCRAYENWVRIVG